MEDGRQFIPLYFDVISSNLFAKISGDAFKLYETMRRFVCRSRSDHSLSLFYTQGALAVSGYIASYANIFGVSSQTAGRWVKELEDLGVIRTYRKGTKHAPAIWILGRVQHIEGSQWGNELFFLDHIAIAQEEDHRIVEAFDEKKLEECLSPKLDSFNFTIPLLEVEMEVEMEVFNREDIIEKSNKLPQPEVAATADLEELEYVDLEDEETQKPKWARPETMEQKGMLYITGRKWFQSGEKSKTKAILKAFSVGDMLGDDVYSECIRQIGDREKIDFATLPPLPRSWLTWRIEHARRNRWSYSGLLNALIDRDQLVTHCRYILKQMGAPQNIPKVEIENGVRVTTLAHDPSQGPVPKYAGPEEGRIEV